MNDGLYFLVGIALLTAGSFLRWRQVIAAAFRSLGR